MNWVDILVLVVLALAGLWGFRAGLLRMLLPLVAVAVGLFLASRFAGPVGRLFSPLAHGQNAQTIAAFITIFVLVLLAGAIAMFMLRAIMNFLAIFGLIDRLAGLLLGLLVGAVLLSGVLTALERYPVADVRTDIQDSKLGVSLADKFNVVLHGINLIPADWNN